MSLDLPPDHPLLGIEACLKLMGTERRAAFDEDRFIELVRNSVSLSFQDKVRVLESVPSLDTAQIKELVATFTEELDYFSALKAEHSSDWDILRQQSIEIMENRTPHNRPAIGDLIAVGDTRLAKNDPAGAEMAYREALQIARAIVIRQGSNPTQDAQRGLLISWNRVGDALLILGDPSRAEQAFRESLAIAQGIVDQQGDEPTVKAQHHLSVSWVRLGDALLALDKLAYAEKATSEGLQIAQAIVDSEGDQATQEDSLCLSVSLLNLGYTRRMLGDLSGAEKAFRQALEIQKRAAAWTQEESPSLEARHYLPITWMNIGDLRLWQGDPASAEQAFLEAQRIIQEIKNKQGRHATLETQRDDLASWITIGNARRTHGDVAGAEQAYLKAVEIAQAVLSGQGNRPTLAARSDLADSWLSIGQTRLLCSDPEWAEQACRKALEIWENIVSEQADLSSQSTRWVRRNIATLRSLIGRTLLSRGRNSDAREFFHEARMIRNTILADQDDQPTLAARQELWSSWIDVCDAQRAQDDQAGAEKSCIEALQIAESIVKEQRERPTLEARQNLSISCERMGHVFRAQGSPHYARKQFLEALEIRKAILDEQGNYPTVDAQLGLVNALYLCAEATQEVGKDGWENESYELLRRCQSLLTEYLVAIPDSAHRAQKKIELNPIPLSVWDVSLRILMKDSSREDCLITALEADEGGRCHRLREMIAGHLRFPEGMEEKRKVRLHRHLRRYRGMIEAILEQLAGDPGTAVRSETMPRLGEMHRHGAIPAFAPIPSEESEETRAARARIRAEQERRLRKLHDEQARFKAWIRNVCGFDPDAVGGVPGFDTKKLRDKSTDEPDTAYLSINLADWSKPGLGMILIHAGEMTAAWQDGQKAVEALAAYQEQADHSRGVAELLDGMAEIIAPMVESLLDERPVRKVIISVDDPLSRIPVPHLTGSDGEPLSKRWDIVVTPSLALYLHLRTDQADSPNGGAWVIDGSEPGIPLAAIEARMVAGAWGGASDKAPDLKARLSDRRSEFAALHYAGHASYDRQNPWKSALKCPPNKSEADHLNTRDLLTSVYLSGRPLVVLNACEGGLGEAGKHGEAMSLALGWLVAGAGCVLSALWKVEDLSSAIFGIRFSETIAQGMTAVQALRAAQHHLREELDTVETVKARYLERMVQAASSDAENDAIRNAFGRLERSADEEGPPFAHPSHWAGYVLHGLGDKTMPPAVARTPAA